MNDRHDTEKTLRQFRHHPGARVKPSLMSEYRSAFGGEARPNRIPLWKHPIPLYAAAIAFVLTIGIAFVAGQRVSMTSGNEMTMPPPGPVDGVMTSDDIEWRVAERDLL